jgi:hypothetical protein
LVAGQVLENDTKPSRLLADGHDAHGVGLAGVQSGIRLDDEFERAGHEGLLSRTWWLPIPAYALGLEANDRAKFLGCRLSGGLMAGNHRLDLIMLGGVVDHVWRSVSHVPHMGH